VLLLLAPALTHAQGAGADSVALTWTAVGDDSLTGTATLYDLRMSGAPITLSTWGSATAIDGLPAPRASGTTQQVVVRGLTGGTAYYFALRVRDDAGNWSGLSNVVRWDGLDTSPLAAPTGVVAELSGDGMHVTWQPSAAPDLAGYSVYRASSQNGTYTKLNLDLITSAEYQDNTLPLGALSVWYQVTATNASGNESAHSASAQGVLVEQSPALAWAIEPAYPNPSHVGDPVRIPVELASAGQATRLDVVDAVGRLVRRIDLQELAPGRQEVQWDGRNDAGRAVAPGPYRVWLVAGDQRHSARLVRVP
jgi:hypothetical protein